MAARTSTSSRILPRLSICGSIMLLGYVGLFCLLQAPALWYNLRPDPIRSLFADIFGPINSLFPMFWVKLEQMDNLALLLLPGFVAVIILIFAPLLYLLRQL